MRSICVQIIASVAVMCLTFSVQAEEALCLTEPKFAAQLATAPHGKIMPMPSMRPYKGPPNGLEPYEFVLMTRFQDADGLDETFVLARGISRVRPGLVLRIWGERRGRRVETNAVAFQLRVSVVVVPLSDRPDQHITTTWIRTWIPRSFRVREVDRQVVSIIAPPGFPEPSNPLIESIEDHGWCGLVASRPAD